MPSRMPSIRQSQRQWHLIGRASGNAIGCPFPLSNAIVNAGNDIGNAIEKAMPSDRQNQGQCHRIGNQRKLHKITIGGASSDAIVLAMPARLMAIFSRQCQRQCHRIAKASGNAIGGASSDAIVLAKPAMLMAIFSRQCHGQSHRIGKVSSNAIGGASSDAIVLAMPARLMAIFSWQCHRIGKASGNANPLSNSTRQCHQQCHRLPISARQWQRINPTWFFAQNSFFIKSSQIRTIERG